MANRNRVEIPEAKPALDNLKYEVAEEIGLHDYAHMDKANLTSRQNGSVGGFMVKKMVEAYESSIANK